MKKIKFIVCSLIIVLFTSISTGCGYMGAGTEIDKLTLIRVIGLDKEGDDQIRLTVTSQRPGTQNRELSPHYVSAVGSSISEVVSRYEATSELTPFWGFVEYIVISEELAKENIWNYLDILTHQYKLRLDISVLIAKGDTCLTMFKKSVEDDLFLRDTLEDLFETTKDISLITTVSLAEVAKSTLEPSHAFVLPVIELVKESNIATPLLTAKGYALFRDSCLIAFTTVKEAIGLTILRHKYLTGYILIKDRNNKPIGLDVTKIKYSIQPRIEEDVTVFKINAHISCVILEYAGSDNLFEPDYIRELENQISELFLQWISDAIRLTQENSADCIGAQKYLHIYEAGQWYKQKDSWSTKDYANAKFELNVSSIIRRTYSLKEPLA